MNTVPKGANRAAAAGRTAKHAQRTPLPPRPGQVEAAREPIENHGEAPDTKSQGKALAFAEKAVAAKWSVATAVVAGAVEVTVTRDSELMVQAWRNGVWDYTVSYYTFGDRDLKPRNAAGAIRLLARPVAEAAAEASKVASNKHFRKAEPKDIVVRLEDAQRALPFDPSTDADELITGILAGQALVWYNRLSRGTESAIVGRKGVRLTRLPDGQRVAHFCCPATGYRSLLVTAILKVGRGRQSTNKAETETVEVA